MQLLAEAGQTFRGQELTPEMIADVVDTFDEVGRAPLTFGHPRTGQEPKAGDVLQVATNADNTRLFGSLKTLDKVKKAVDEGFFDDRSVGIGKTDDGRHYLHHLALLGGTPPQIKGMEPLKSLDIDFSDSDQVLHFGMDPSSEHPEEYADTELSRLLADGIQQRIDEEEDTSRADVVEEMGEKAGITSGTVNQILRGEIMRPPDRRLDGFARALPITRTQIDDAIPEEASDEGLMRRFMDMLRTALSDDTTTTAMSDANDETTDLSDLSQDELEAELDRRASEEGGNGDDTDDFADSELYQEMSEELKRAKENRRKSEVEAVRSAAEGKLPADQVDAFADLARALPDTVETSTFSDSEDEEEVSPRQRLADVLSELPDLVQSGPMDFSDLEENGDDGSEETKDLAAEM